MGQFTRITVPQPTKCRMIFVSYKTAPLRVWQMDLSLFESLIYNREWVLGFIGVQHLHTWWAQFCRSIRSLILSFGSLYIYKCLLGDLLLVIMVKITMNLLFGRYLLVGLVSNHRRTLIFFLQTHYTPRGLSDSDSEADANAGRYVQSKPLRRCVERQISLGFNMRFFSQIV